MVFLAIVITSYSIHYTKLYDLEDLNNSELVVSTSERLDVVMKQLYVQSTSFDEVIKLAKQKDEMLRCVPAIMPIANRDLTRTASGWGMRIHPIYKIKKFHYGMRNNFV